MKISKKRYIQGFGVLTIVLALIRCACPQIAQPSHTSPADTDTDTTAVTTDSIQTENPDTPVNTTDKDATTGITPVSNTKELSSVGKGSYHPIYSVPRRFQDHFPDSQSVHLSAATKWGVKPVANRMDAEKRMNELVYIGASPYLSVDNLRSSVPYLVPRAANLINDIGRQYFDSLYVKGIPFHKIIITSALRTKEDVAKLQRRNGNATENSAHLYGTTIDIAQNRFKTVEAPGHPRRQVQNDTLKWILSEVLRDFRESGRCYIKYEVKQGCFHITVR